MHVTLFLFCYNESVFHDYILMLHPGTFVVGANNKVVSIVVLQLNYVCACLCGHIQMDLLAKN